MSVSQSERNAENTGRREHVSKDLADRVYENWNGSLAETMRLAGVKSKSERRWHRIRRGTEKILGVELVANEQDKSPERNENQCPSYLDVKKAKQAKSFIITSATNNSTLNARFFDTLEVFAENTESQLLVLPLKYRHSNLIRRDDYSWPDRIHDYALNSDLKVSPSLVISGGAGILATAVNPLSGMSANSGFRSAVYGHPQVALQCVATPGNQLPKVMATTGSCTSASYSNTKTGAKARFHHSFSALYVKMVKGGRFHLTQVHWDGKGFYLLDKCYKPDGVTGGHKAAALVQGDTHAVWSDKEDLSARQRLLDNIKPDTLVWHDLHDHKSQSHHNTVTERVRLAQTGGHIVEDELKLSADLLNDFGKGRENLIIGSNHNDHLHKWLDKHEDKKDPVNAPLAARLKCLVYASDKGPFELWLEPRLKVKAKFVDRNKEYKIKTIDVSQHGDIGANGSRGSAKGFGRLPRKTVIGHSHTSGIEKGCYQVGVSTLKMEYAQGYSSWSICDCIIYSNGKRGLIFQIDGKSLADLV